MLKRRISPTLTLSTSTYRSKAALNVKLPELVEFIFSTILLYSGLPLKCTSRAINLLSWEKIMHLRLAKNQNFPFLNSQSSSWINSSNIRRIKCCKVSFLRKYSTRSDSNFLTMSYFLTLWFINLTEICAIKIQFHSKIWNLIEANIVQLSAIKKN